MLKTRCTYEAKEGESRWSAIRRRMKDVESDRDDLIELITYMQDASENDAMRTFHRIRAHDFGDPLRFIRHARVNDHSLQRDFVSQQVPSEQQCLPPIRTMVESCGLLPSQEQVQSRQAGDRERAPSMFSNARSAGVESYPSDRSIAGTTGDAQTSRRELFAHGGLSCD